MGAGSVSTSASGNVVTITGSGSGPGAWVYLGTGTGSTIVFDNTYMTDTYRTYMFMGRFISANNSQLQVSTDNGSSWKTAVNDYYGNVNSGGTEGMEVLSSGTNYSGGGRFVGWIYDPTNASYKTTWIVDAFRHDTSTATNSRMSLGAERASAEDNDAIRFINMGSSAIVSIYGLNES
ncbi:MAG: hypothetical protein PVF17_00620 [Ignavibacteria bacterium]